MNRRNVGALLLCCACNGTPQVSKPQLGARGWVPFDFHNEEYIFLRGSINGHEADFMLDSGAEISLMDQSFAERIGLRVDEKLNVSGVGGGTHGKLARNVEVAVSNMAIGEMRMAVLDLSGFQQGVGRHFQAILSAEVFADLVVDIDYPHRRIAFRSAEDFEYGGPGRTVRTRALGRGRHAIEGKIEGHGAAWYLVDTGSSSTITIARRLARRQALLEGRAPTSQQISGGVGGLVKETTASVESFRIGGFELRDIPIVVSGEKAAGFASKAFDGILGGGVLSRFRVLFDFGRGKVHLEPGLDWQLRGFPRNLLGLAVIPAGRRLRVLFVEPGSPSRLAGWEAGMFVTGVDGVRGTATELRAALRSRNRAGIGTRVVLWDERGIQRPVVLARYY